MATELVMCGHCSYTVHMDVESITVRICMDAPSMFMNVRQGFTFTCLDCGEEHWEEELEDYCQYLINKGAHVITVDALNFLPGGELSAPISEREFDRTVALMQCDSVLSAAAANLARNA